MEFLQNTKEGKEIGDRLGSMDKVYVSVTVSFSSDGVMRPLNIKWEDGYIYDIDRIVDVAPSPAVRTGAPGYRYRIRIRGKESFLFFEKGYDFSPRSNGKWFVERKRRNK